MTTPEPARTQPNEVLHHVKAVAPHLRIDTLKRALDVVQAMISGQSVNLSVLSDHLPGESSVEAKKRRAERAFRDEQLSGELFLGLDVAALPTGQAAAELGPDHLEALIFATEPFGAGRRSARLHAPSRLDGPSARRQEQHGRSAGTRSASR